MLEIYLLKFIRKSSSGLIKIVGYFGQVNDLGQISDFFFISIFLNRTNCIIDI